MISVNNLNKHFDDNHVLKNVTHTFKEGKTTVIIGSSGSGKSTLLRCLNNLEKKDNGSIYIGDDNIDTISNSSLTLNVGMVFQQFNLFSNMNVLENVMYALVKVKKFKKTKAKSIALNALEKVNLSDKLQAYPINLSGGQQQRVAIARTLVMNPQVILFDEPTSSLDPEMVNEVLDEIKSISQSGITCIIVTHEMNFAKEIADEVIYMDNGTIIETNTPKNLFTNPKQPRTKQFLEKIL